MLEDIQRDYAFNVTVPQHLFVSLVLNLEYIL